ncbi:hypothetical protein HZH68_005334 [Vespula germanica]|uniref:Uncharacterized protein n=1 Tax=Vespula germanica TaxID=30212 RepID=A0A834NEE9_VESGE|nr:hypothetical protein HZH68_005334 [Vespula germanica]
MLERHGRVKISPLRYRLLCLNFIKSIEISLYSKCPPAPPKPCCRIILPPRIQEIGCIIPCQRPVCCPPPPCCLPLSPGPCCPCPLPPPLCPLPPPPPPPPKPCCPPCCPLPCYPRIC